MRDSIYRFTLDIHNLASQVQITAKKNDNARTIYITLMENGKPYIIDEGCRAVLMMRKPDDTILFNDCDIIDNGGAVAYEFTNQTTSADGLCHCEIRLYSSEEEVITSPKFTILVTDAVYDDGQVESTSEFTALTEAMSQISDLEAYVSRAEEAADNAEVYANDCADAVTLAEEQVTLAEGQVSLATDQANSSLASATSSYSYAELSKSYAVGTEGSVRPLDENDNAKYYKEQCEQIATSMQGGFIPMGTIAFANLPSNPTAGWMYNISNEFTSDSRFKDGGGKNYASGTNVYATADLMWDCLSGSIPIINGKSGNSITLNASDIIMEEYQKAQQGSPIETSDTVSSAIAKLEARETDLKLIKDEWVDAPALSNYTNYADSSNATENHWTMDVVGGSAIGGMVECSWSGDSWVGYTIDIKSDVLNNLKGKTIEFGACVYNPTYSTWCYYQLNINDGQHYIQKADLHTGSDLIRENTDGIALRYTVPSDITALRFDLVQGSHSSTPEGSIQIGYAYIVDVNEFDMPDEDNTYIQAVRKTSVQNYTYGSNQLVFSKEGSISMSDALGNVTELSNMEKLNKAIRLVGDYVVGGTIEAGSESFTYSSALIHEDTIIDVYYTENSKSVVAKAKPSYSQSEGSMTITFENALESDVSIAYIHIVNP